MLVYVRHGATALNKGGSEERLRGWLPVPLAAKGILQAKATAKTLTQMLPGKPATFTASDLNRAQQTAGIVGKALDLQAQPDSRIRDWNTGDLAGQKVEDVLPLLKGLIKTPDVAAPNGEPLNAYLQRFVPTMREKVAAPGIHLVVGHARGSVILEGIASEVGGKGGEIDPKFLLERPQLQPGGVMIVTPNWDVKIHNTEV